MMKTGVMKISVVFALLAILLMAGCPNPALEKLLAPLFPEEEEKPTDPVIPYDPSLPTPAAADYTFGNLTQTAGSVTPVTITAQAGKSPGAITVYYNGSTTIPQAAGTYAVTFDVAAVAGWNAATGLSAGTLTVYQSVFTVASTTDWNYACTTIANSGDNRNYTITLTGDFDVPGGSTVATFGTASGITVTITGNHTLALQSGTTGRLLHIDIGQKVTIDGITLKGHSSNANPFVFVTGNGASLTMNSGSITDNTSAGPDGGGGVMVYDTGASFIMNGGSITNNYSPNYGGGVTVTYNGVFTMNGGSITNNTANTNGGAVCVLYATFNYIGGTISGNSTTEVFNRAGGTIIGWP